MTLKQSALKVLMKRMYPDILNYDKLVEILGDFKAPMGSFIFTKLERCGRSFLK
ncbi:hypothetical protein ACV56Z_12225 [Staphylococcus aureus]